MVDIVSTHADQLQKEKQSHRWSIFFQHGLKISIPPVMSFNNSIQLCHFGKKAIFVYIIMLPQILYVDNCSLTKQVCLVSCSLSSHTTVITTVGCRHHMI